MTSQNKSRPEYLIPTDNIIVIDWYLNLTNKRLNANKSSTCKQNQILSSIWARKKYSNGNDNFVISIVVSRI